MAEQTELEKELLNSVTDLEQKTSEWKGFLHEEAEMYDDWRQKWLDRPEDLDKLVKSNNWEIRMDVAYIGRGKDLDQLVNDEEDVVRANVVRRGRKQDILALIGDPSKYVQEALRTQIELNFEDLEYCQEKVKSLQKSLKIWKEE